MKIKDLFEDEGIEMEDAAYWTHYLADQFYHIVQQHKNDVADTDSIPAGPDTTKFRATRSGMIEVVENQQVHGGQYGVDKLFAVGIKVGGNVDRAVHDKIKQEVQNEWTAMTNNLKADPEEYHPDTLKPNANNDGLDGIQTTDGSLYYSDTYGTNWSMYGVVIYKR